MRCRSTSCRGRRSSHILIRCSTRRSTILDPAGSGLHDSSDAGAGTRNHLLLDAPVRNGSFRTLGAHGNIFAIESFMDELADVAGIDPLSFRLAHLRDPRARAVLQAAAEKACWTVGKKSDGRNRSGLSCCQYESISVY